MSDEHMSDKDMDAVLREWTQDAPAGQPDRSRVVGDVVRQLGSTRRRRWRLRSIFRRGAPHATASKTSPIPATNGHTPTVIGRTTSMFSPVKAITAGAIVFALGGVLLIAQPFDQGGGGVPGAATDSEPVEALFTATDPPEADWVVDGRIMPADNEQGTAPFEASDPRFSGLWTFGFADHVVSVEDGVFGGVESVTVRIVTDGGEWSGTGPRTWARGVDGFTSNGMYTLAGAGDEEGLTLVLSERCDEETETCHYSGIVINTEMPLAPDLLPVE